MKILITGAQGQVGSELVSVANQSKHTIFATTRSELDITQAKNVDTYVSQHQPDIVINAAAYTAVDKAEKEHDLAYAINRDGAKNLALICSKNNIPLFHISTNYVFNGSKTDAYCEENDVSPLGVYGGSKWDGEESIRDQMEQFIILRVAWVFGSQGNNFVKTMIRLGKNKDELNIVADQFGGPTPAKNIAETLIRLVDIFQKDKTLLWGTYHYCGQEKTTWYGFAKEIFQQAKKNGLLDKDITLNPITTEQYPTPAKRPKNSMLDCSKLKRTFGIDMPDWHTCLNEILIELK